MTKAEKVLYVLFPLGMVGTALSLSGVFSAIFKLDRFGPPEYAVLMLVVTLVLMGTIVMAALVVAAQMLWMTRHNSPAFSQERWWHLYFGSAAALAGFIMAFAVCISDCVSWIDFALLAAAAIATCALARYKDSGTTFDVATKHSYGILFGFVFVAPTLLVGIIFS